MNKQAGTGVSPFSSKATGAIMDLLSSPVISSSSDCSPKVPLDDIRRTQTWGLSFQQMDFDGHIASTAASQLLPGLPPALVFLSPSFRVFTISGRVQESQGHSSGVLNSPCGDLTHILYCIYYQAY